ncbi:MAG: AraC family transcriptional regulator ligand-binding domain-containing protein [Deltaproteobacteria bacterium]|nr:AraC family transcriptional regulator ligand-binding domain-containing protein [Deltaproteobacteria bacterium]
MPGQVIASYVRPFAQHLRAGGKDPLALAKRVGIPDPEKAKSEWLTRAQVRTYLDEAALEIRDPDLGLTVAREREKGSYGLVEFGTRSAPDLRGALAFTLTYSPLLKEGMESYFDEDDTAARFGFGSPDDALGLGRHGHEYKLLAALMIIRDVLGGELEPGRIWLAHPAPADLRGLRAVAPRSEFLFGQSDNGFSFPKEALDQRLVSADPALFAFLSKQAARLLAAPRETPFIADVRTRLGKLLAAGTADVEALAKQLHMSSRTLQRRLEGEGLKFQGLLDQMRQQLARRLVGQSEQETEDISKQLGYANVTAFLRAFKRWTAMSPTEYRRRARRGDEG